MCAICLSPEAKNKASKYLHVDHDHSTGAVRALLCSRCNFAIGALEENPEFCESAAAYLRRHKQEKDA